MKPTRKDYIYCEDCESFADYWKYDHDIRDAGHEMCEWRFVTKTELAGLIASCEEEGCFEENIIGIIVGRGRR